MGRLSKCAAAALLVLAPAKAEADSWFYFSATNAPGYCNYIPRGFYGPMVYWHARTPVYGFYSSGFFMAPRVRINLVRYESAPGEGETERLYYERTFGNERFRGATVEEGEEELFRLLGKSGLEFGWRKYVRRRNGGYYQVDAILGRRIFDVVPTGDDVLERSGEIEAMGYEYHGIPANRFNTRGEIKGGVRQEVSPAIRRRQ